MNILYIGRHNQPNNDDEGAVAWSLRRLGHSVTEIEESQDIYEIKKTVNLSSFNFFLFHKSSPSLVSDLVKYLPGVCWFFDALYKGWNNNDKYIDQVYPMCRFLFLTDGDYNNDGCFHVCQGFDSRRDDTISNISTVRDIAFLGHISNSGGYKDRYDMVRHVSSIYKDQFTVNTTFSIFNDKLTQYCQQTKIMLASKPVTDKYWSNRVYNLGGRGAFLIHPYSIDLHKQLPMIPMYKCNSELCELIDYYLENNIEREKIRKKLQLEINSKHTYFDRCRYIMSLINL
jgi:hypothetical protein